MKEHLKELLEKERHRIQTLSDQELVEFCSVIEWEKYEGAEHGIDVEYETLLLKDIIKLMLERNLTGE